MKSLPLRTAVAGIGGFANMHHTALAELEAEGLVQVMATCDPSASRLADRILHHRFEQRGVEIYADFQTLLISHLGVLDLIIISSPIQHHAAHHLACVKAGAACYLEKPPTLDPDELELMISAESGAARSTQVGFNYISQPWRLRLKERILQGDFGKLRHVGFMGAWRRSLAYYKRNGWAGRLLIGDRVLLDSCCGNAMSHYLHNLLFHAGVDLLSWAAPETVEAELYRANRIDAPDTVFARGMLANQVSFSLAATHACTTRLLHREIIACEDAVITIPEAGNGTVRFRDGREEAVQVEAASLKENLRGYCEFLCGRRDRAVTTLPDCRPFVTLNALLYTAASAIHPVETAVTLHVDGDSCETRCIPGVEDACMTMLSKGLFPSEQKLTWGRSGGRSWLEDVTRLRSALLPLIGQDS